MKMKITLTKEQVDKLVETETKALQVKIDREIAALRKKYEVVEVEIDSKSPVKQTKNTKLTDELFNEYLSKELTIKEIAIQTGYNEAYLRKKKKSVLSVN